MNGPTVLSFTCLSETIVSIFFSMSAPQVVEDEVVPSINVPPVPSLPTTSPQEDEERFQPLALETVDVVETAAQEAATEQEDDHSESLTVSVHVQVDSDATRNLGDNGAVVHNQLTSSQSSQGTIAPISPLRSQGEGTTHHPSVRRPRQSTLIGSLLPLSPVIRPPPPPQLPNLALAALERLSENRLASGRDDSIDDFRPLKKRKLAPESENLSEDAEEGQTCSICFEPWSNSGGHRIASLKCGHLFGLNCIEKWVKGQGGGKCPQCNAKAKKTDIRVIFAKSIAVVDTTDRDRAIMERDEEKVMRITAQKAEAQAVLQYQLARAECDRLKEQLRVIRQQLEVYVNRGIQSADCASNSTSVLPLQSVPTLDIGSDDDNACYAPYKKIIVSSNGGARVLAHDASLNILVASKPSSNHLLPGYGLMKYNTLDLGHGEYVAAHGGVIRDAEFNPVGNGLVLTASMDKTCRLTSIHSNSNVLTYKTPSPVWACAWNVDDPNYVYAGLNGSICIYDVRNTTESVCSLQTEGDRAPITSLSYVPLCRVSTLNAGGLLAGTLNGAVFWQRDNNQESFTPHSLNTIQGNCTSLSFEPATRHCMASFRPSKRLPGTPHSTHVLCQLCNTPQDKPFSCRPIHQFTGGTTHRLLSRSCLFQRPGNDNQMLAAFGIEENRSVSIWNTSTMTRLQSLRLPQSPALDIIPLSAASGKDLLAILSETTISLFHWQHEQLQSVA